MDLSYRQQQHQCFNNKQHLWLNNIFEAFKSYFPNCTCLLEHDYEQSETNFSVQKTHIILIIEKQQQRKNFESISSFSIIKNRGFFQIRRSLIYNGNKLFLQNKSMRIQISKYFMKIEDNHDPWSCQINTQTGDISLVQKLLLSPIIISRIISNNDQSHHYITIIKQTLINLKEKQQIILFLINQCQLKQIQCIPELKDKKQFIKTALNDLKILKKSLFHKVISLQYCTKIKNISHEKILSYLCSKHQFFTPQVEQIIKSFTQKPIYNFNLRPLNQQLIKYQSNYRQTYDCILKRIKILSFIINWIKLRGGGHGIIQVAQIQFEDLVTNTIMKRNIMKKSDQFLSQKIKHELDILQYIGDKNHKNIKYHMYSQQQKYTNCLFTELENNLSLDHYLTVNKQTITMSTKLKFILGLVDGLIFLSDNNIVHLDVKPGNLLVTEDLQIKIIDFGQAYIIGSNYSEYSRSYTIPYVSPQFFNQKPTITIKSDIYSLGVTIFRVIFGQHIWDNISNKGKFVENLRQSKNNICLIPQKLNDIQQIIANLCLECINTKQQLRPMLDWIKILLFECQKYLQSFYL